jgi:hypothetical protein
MTHICKTCSCEYERWQGVYCKEPKHCKPCSDRRHAPQAGTIVPCGLCGNKFAKPTGREGSRVFCERCYDIPAGVRGALMRQKRAGQPIHTSWFKSKKVVDNKEYLPVLVLMNLPIEKMVRKLNDRNVIFTGIPNVGSQEQV